MTYSIVALDPDTGELGVGVQTHQPAVGSVVPWLMAGVGAVATQARANMAFGPQALGLLESGLDAIAALKAILAGDDAPEVRQVAIVDAGGRVAVHTGSECIPEFGSAKGAGYSAQANMMLNPGVPEAMATAFEAASGQLAYRIMAALDAAQAAGGDIRGAQSAALRVTRRHDRLPAAASGRRDYGLDLRVDHDPAPLAALRRLLDLKTAKAILDDPEDFKTPEAVRAAFQRAMSLYPWDELLFWHAVQLSTGRFGLHDEAQELLAPLIDRAPQWRELLHRLPDLPPNSPLRHAFPR